VSSNIAICPFEVKQITEDNDYFYVEGIASPYNNIDQGDDIVVPGAFTRNIQEKGTERPALWQHNVREPVGVLTLKDSVEHLGCTIRMPKSDSFVAGRVMPQVKTGSVTGLSIGYRTIDYSMEQREGRDVRMLRQVEVHEVSLVTFPMNEKARVTAAKNFVDSSLYKEETTTETEEKPVIFTDELKKQIASSILEELLKMVEAKTIHEQQSKDDKVKSDDLADLFYKLKHDRRV
jgi:HK97 family phage prohead protease